jgi:hypothetical protein
VKILFTNKTTWIESHRCDFREAWLTSRLAKEAFRPAKMRRLAA